MQVNWVSFELELEPQGNTGLESLQNSVGAVVGNRQYQANRFGLYLAIEVDIPPLFLVTGRLSGVRRPAGRAVAGREDPGFPGRSDRGNHPGSAGARIQGG